MNNQILDSDVQEFIRTNEKSDVRKLALQKNPFPNIDYRDILNQIVCLAKAKNKLPTFYATQNIYYPSRVSMEQCSSEIAAEYKANLVSGKYLVDLTGGFGVDAMAFAKRFENVVHCEKDAALSQIAKHNFETMDLSNIETFAGDGLDFLNGTTENFDVIYIDPSRRDENDSRVFSLNDCAPNVVENAQLYLQKTDCLLIKASPILDISLAQKQLETISEIHIIAIENDVKELLLILHNNTIHEIKINTVNIQKNSSESFSFIQTNDECARFSHPKKYIYEPNASIMKSGGFNEITKYIPVEKLHPNSHLYTSEDVVEFPGRIFEVLENTDYSGKKMERQLAALVGRKCNITVRNFPLTVAQIRKKWKIKDGGNNYCFFTTDLDDRKIALFCKKLHWFMKLSPLLFLFAFSFVKAQQPCDFVEFMAVDSTLAYKSSADVMLYENNFGKSSDYIIASLIVSKSSPLLSLQFIDKSATFAAAKCLSKSSKVFLQLDNGKIVTLFHVDNDDCGSLVNSVGNTQSRVLTGYFLFVKDVFEELKSSKINLMRVRFATETVDYIIRTEIKSELDGKNYKPASYFLDYFHCMTETF